VVNITRLDQHEEIEHDERKFSPPDLMESTTAFSITNRRIVREFGTVRGIVVRSRTIFGSIGGTLQTLFGGDITLFTSLCEKTRNDAFGRMCAHAQELGANAVIGVRYDASAILGGVTEVICYGTAVLIEEDASSRPPSR
jgi:uncharacterized protein YbjQ (UPF0145 family)